MADLSKFIDCAKSFFLQRAAGYCLIVLSSLFVICPLGVLQTKMDGQCLLYSDALYEEYNHSNGSISILWRMRFGARTVCQYSLAVSAIFSLIYSLAMIGVYIFIYFREKDSKETDLGHVVFLVHGVIEIVITILMLVSACTISHGFTVLCSGLTNTNIPDFTLNSCSDVEHDQWIDHDGSNFFVCLAVATAGSWFQFVFWLLQSIFVMWKLWKLNMLPVLPDWMKRSSSA